MSRTITTGFTAGFLGALLLIVVMVLMQALDLAGDPGFIGNYRAVFHTNSPLDPWISGLLFALSGGVWGAIYAAVVKRPNVMNGMVFGLLPTLWLWLVVLPVTGKPAFGGFAPPALLMPILFNIVLWGSFIGWYCSRHIRNEAPAPPP